MDGRSERGRVADEDRIDPGTAKRGLGWSSGKGTYETRPRLWGAGAHGESGGAPGMLDTRRTWSDSDRYDAQARRLAVLFQENFEQFKDQAPPEVHATGPRAR
jgi:hypothetical protein